MLERPAQVVRPLRAPARVDNQGSAKSRRAFLPRRLIRRQPAVLPPEPRPRHGKFPRSWIGEGLVAVRDVPVDGVKIPITTDQVQEVVDGNRAGGRAQNGTEKP